jgi:hypothetical protein
MFTKTNCPPGGVGSDFLYNQAYGAVTSTISQADADARGLSKFNTDGQAAINAGGSCRFSSVARSGSFIKNNCALGTQGSAVTYNQPAGAVTSIVSQADADSFGLSSLNYNGQIYANANGSCTPITFSYNYVFNEDTGDIDMYVNSSSSNHNGATFNLRIRYYGATGGLKNLDKTIVLPAGQTSAHAAYRTTAFSIYDVQLLSLIKQ